jgi:hypothetical protein
MSTKAMRDNKALVSQLKMMGGKYNSWQITRVFSTLSVRGVLIKYSAC